MQQSSARDGTPIYTHTHAARWNFFVSHGNRARARSEDDPQKAPPGTRPNWPSRDKPEEEKTKKKQRERDIETARDKVVDLTRDRTTTRRNMPLLLFSVFLFIYSRNLQVYVTIMRRSRLHAGVACFCRIRFSFFFFYPVSVHSRLNVAH